ncbi:hypothetical protein NQ318_013369 [Aromia moschata]|uniref:Uncharacterized protein n=1 Tax=Aromia moschata TaxID=1265417 RepID=A0AAV8XUV7_9CUCU|nr:hypothetical protein NQ318_013369 [Aromia moschata]
MVVLGCLLAAARAADEHRPKKKKTTTIDDRGKRNLDYQISHHYSGPHSYHRLERRIATGPQHPPYNPQSQFYPGPPRPHAPYRKGRPNSYPPVPPYAVQMEPLVQYSQRDPLYDINLFSLNADPSNALARDDALTESNQVQEKIHHEVLGYGPHKPHVIERPVYIKEPEPIIEIIIKESNVSLPPPPTAPPPKKKKEQVQVFYVKYKKNPHGTGKDSVIYEKPVPAITPKLPEEEEEEEEPPYHYHQEPDSEVYHSPSGVKVTFGKEGFDYEKRSSKPEDFNPSQPAQFPQGRQLTSFSNTYFKRPLTNENFQAPPPAFRQPQPYRPFVFPPPSAPTNYKPLGRQTPQFPTQPKYPTFQSPSFGKPASQQYTNFQGPRPQGPPAPQFSHTISHPPPPNFQSARPSPAQGRQPVAYKPFDNLRPQQPQQAFVPSPQSQPPHVNPNVNQHQVQFRPETHFPTHQQLPLIEQSLAFNSQRIAQQTPQVNGQQQFKNEEPSPSRVQPTQPPQQQVHYQHQISHLHSQNQQQQQLQRQQLQQKQSISQNEHLNNIQAVQGALPPEGQLIQSLPKYEQHISEVHPKILEQFNLNEATSKQRNPQEELLQQQQQIQTILDQQRRQQQEQLRTAQQYYQQEQQSQHRNIQNEVSHTTPRVNFQSTRRTTQYADNSPRITYQTTTTRPTTTTVEPETPSTTTKDPKILEAQLPRRGARRPERTAAVVGDPEQRGHIGSGLRQDGLLSVFEGSDPEPAVLRPDGGEVEDRLAAEDDQLPDASEVEEVRAVAAPPPVEMKVVRYDPDTDKGKNVQESYVDEDAQQVDPVVLNDSTYNRYFVVSVPPPEGERHPVPIPDVPELKGKKISSVVVLAPVSYDFTAARKARAAPKASGGGGDLDLIQGDALKRLLAEPTLENYEKFLESENRTRSDKQAVILLVADPSDASSKDKEIFMYDVATKTVSKLSGELSSAFVEAAEANSDDAPDNAEAAAASNIIETRVPYEGDIDRQDVPAVDLASQDEVMETAEASEQLESFVDASGARTDPRDSNFVGNRSPAIVLSLSETGQS